MNYCPEVAVLHSSLCLLNTQLNKKAAYGGQKEEAVRVVPDLCTVLQEICSGLEQDNSPEQQLAWQQQMHNILLYKTVVTDYAMPSSDDNGNQEEFILDKMEMTCRILPSLNKAVYFEIVKGCGWFQHFINGLRLLEQKFAADLLLDAVTHLSAGKIDQMDMEFNRLVTDYMISQLISSPIESNASSQSNQLSTRNKYQPITGTLFPEQYNQSDGRTQMEVEECSEFSVDKNTLGTMLSDLLTAKIKYRSTSNASDCKNLNVWLEEFCQFLLLGMLGCDEFLTPDNQLSDWFRWNVYGRLNVNTKLDQTVQCFGRLSKTIAESTALEKTLDLNQMQVKSLSKKFPWQPWAEFINLMKSDFISECISLDTMLLCRDIRLVHQVCFESLTGKSAKPCYSTLCNAINLLHKFRTCLQNCGNTDSYKSLSDSLKSSMANILQFVDDLIQKSEVKTDHHLDWLLSAVVWRIDHKQPGNQEMLQKLTASSDAKVWSSAELLETLQRRPEVIGSATLLLQLYRMVADLYTQNTVDTQILVQLKQLVLDGFCRLTTNMQDKHLTHVYMVYRHWPVYDDQLTSHVTSVLNKLTMEKSEQVMAEVSQLALQNVEAVVKGIVGRGLASPEQADIAMQVFSRIPTVLSSCTEDVSLCQIIHEVMVARQLSPREQQNLLKMVRMAVQPVLPAQNSQEGVPLLDPAKFLLKSVLPYLCLSCDINQPIIATFALELLIGILEALMEHSTTLNRALKAITTDSTPWLLCFAELLQDCVALWSSDEPVINRLQLKEGIEKFFLLLKNLRKVASVEFQGDEWLVSEMDSMDWTVKIRMTELLQPTTYPKMCEKFSSDLTKLPEDDLCLNLLRAVAISDVMLQSVVHICMEAGDITLDYHKVVLVLVQLLPHLITSEWKRCLLFLQRLMGNRQFEVQFRTEAQRAIPLVNLTEIEEPLCLSLLTRDAICLLQHTALATNLSLLTHCSKGYAGVLKDCILNNPGSCSSEGQMFLYSEVFSHICAATWWLPVPTLDPVNVLLLDIVCSLETFKSTASTKRIYKCYTGCLDTVTNCLAFVASTDTQDMVQKKLQDLYT